ncbi:hypothetical protein ABZ584_24560 [Streptomyces antibioticus]|uniref:hypothetical protein n=1 Tax=Streptomyces antibioticus TaxID=1890 RepID=UPI0033CF312C
MKPCSSITALAASNGELEAAILVAQRMLAAYGDSSAVGFSYPQGYGAVTEALRILLHALGAEPDSTSEGRRTVTVPQVPGDRCPAAHVEDPTGCNGPVAVTVLDAHNTGAKGCEHHGARLLASLDGGRVYALPDAPDGAAIRVFKAAASIRPFPWVDGPRTRPSQLSHDENRLRGEDR